MRQHLKSLVEELKRLKQSGVSTVSVSESSMEGLRQAVATLSGGVEKSSTNAEEAPSPTAAAGVRPRLHSRVKTVDEANAIFQKVSDSTKSEASAKMKAASTVSNDLIPKDVVLPEGSKQERWDYLRDHVLNCEVCNKHKHDGC